MGCFNSSQVRHSPLVDREDDPRDEDTSIALSGIPLKVVIVGDEGVGKTTFVLRITNQYSDMNNVVKTIGIDFWRHNIVNVDGENISLQIWDTAGDPRFTKIAEAYYRSAHFFLITFSTTDKSSFQRTSYYVERIQELNYLSNPRMLLIGTKCDLPEQRQVKLEEVQQVASHYSLQYFEISSKDNINFDNFMMALTKLIKEISSTTH